MIIFIQITIQLKTIVIITIMIIIQKILLRYKCAIRGGKKRKAILPSCHLLVLDTIMWSHATQQLSLIILQIMCVAQSINIYYNLVFHKVTLCVFGYSCFSGMFELHCAERRVKQCSTGIMISCPYIEGRKCVMCAQ